jgi:hypothetical protein
VAAALEGSTFPRHFLKVGTLAGGVGPSRTKADRRTLPPPGLGSFVACRACPSCVENSRATGAGVSRARRCPVLPPRSAGALNTGRLRRRCVTAYLKTSPLRLARWVY